MTVNDLAGIMRDVRAASENITTAETRTTRALAELRKSSLDLETKYDGLESSVNDLWKRTRGQAARAAAMFYLSTVLDDFSGYIIAWKRAPWTVKLVGGGQNHLAVSVEE